MMGRKKWSGVCALLLSVFLFSCSNEIPESGPMARKGRTVLAYLVANNNLNTYLEDNVVWMYEALASMPDTCTLLVYYRPRPDDVTFDGPTLMEFVSDGKGNVNGVPALDGRFSFDDVVEVAEKKVYPDDGTYVSVDPQVMRQVLLDMREAAPSDSYGLIFGSHATSWLEAEHKVQSKSFGSDGGYQIDIPVLADVLASCFPEKLDFVLFDACMMGTAEVAYELHDVTDYLIGSVMETMVYGFPYRTVLPHLYGDASGFKYVCDDFISFNKNQSGAWGTCALVDCAKMEDLAVAVENGLDRYMYELADLSPKSGIQQYGANSFKDFSFDVGDFFRVLNGGQIPEDIQSALDEVVTSKSCLSGTEYRYEDVIVDETRFCGIGMYLPDHGIKESWDEYYRTSIAWYQAAGWERFASLSTTE